MKKRKDNNVLVIGSKSDLKSLKAPNHFLVVSLECKLEKYHQQKLVALLLGNYKIVFMHCDLDNEEVVSFLLKSERVLNFQMLESRSVVNFLASIALFTSRNYEQMNVNQFRYLFNFGFLMDTEQAYTDPAYRASYQQIVSQLSFDDIQVCSKQSEVYSALECCLSKRNISIKNSALEMRLAQFRDSAKASVMEAIKIGLRHEEIQNDEKGLGAILYYVAPGILTKLLCSVCLPVGYESVGTFLGFATMTIFGASHLWRTEDIKYEIRANPQNYAYLNPDAEERFAFYY